MKDDVVILLSAPTAYDKYMNALNIWSLCGGVERDYHAFEKLMKQANLHIVHTYPINDGLYLFDIRFAIDEGEI